VQEGRYLADHIPGARMLEVDGTDHAPWLTDPDRFTTEIEEFRTGSHAAPSRSRRVGPQALGRDKRNSAKHMAGRGSEAR
jgi:hypothetical protein